MLDTKELAGPFSNLLGGYVSESYREDEIEAGGHHWAARPLLEALQEDWGIFGPGTLSRKTAESLLAAILGHSVHNFGDQLMHDSWVLEHSTQAMFTATRQFQKFFGCDSISDCLSLENVGHSTEILGTAENQVASNLPYFAVLIEKGRTFFRARQGCERDGLGARKPYDDLGPNPSHPPSRANTNLQYAMYLAENEATAVAEIRLPSSEFGSVAAFLVTQNVTVIDLCQAFGEINPFVPRNFSWILDFGNLLASIKAVISRPALSPLDYALTQHMANIARTARYDGILYPSALDDSQRNLVLFRGHVVQIRNSWVTVA